jgi:retron-type reverse transcriptase
MTNGREKSDRAVVPAKSPNKAERSAAEAMEGRALAKGNSQERNAVRTQSRTAATSALERVRQAATKDKKQRFTALQHHVNDVERLRLAYRSVKRDAAAGIDGETWRHYGEDLEGNLMGLSERLRRGAYRANPVRRAFIPKADGRQRPLGIPTLEDKIVQRATAEVLNAIYETDFLGFSYGFRPGRNQHEALDALAVGIWARKVKWVLDADIRSFFDTMKHEWIVKFLEHRVADERIVRLIQKWLTAGVLEDGKRTRSEEGAVQGGSISPLLANVYLHYVFDLWTQRWRKQPGRGDVIVVRYGRLRRGVRARAGCPSIPCRAARAIREVRSGTSPRQDAHPGVWPLRGQQQSAARRSEARDVRLPWLHAHLREDEKRTLHGA